MGVVNHEAVPLEPIKTLSPGQQEDAFRISVKEFGRIIGAHGSGPDHADLGIMSHEIAPNLP